MRTIGLVAALFFGATAATASPASPIGEWVVGDGGKRVRIMQCGAAYCGAPIEDAAATVAFNLRTARPNHWTGSAIAAASGETHEVSMTLDKSSMVVKGCLEFFCIEQVWRRAN